MENKDKKIKVYEDDFIALCFLIMTLLLAVGIISRVVANFSFAFTEELVVQLYLFTTMFGISGCVIRKSNMGLSIVVNMFPPKIRKWFVLFVYLVSVAFFAFVGYQGMKLVITQFKLGYVTPVLQMKSWAWSTCFPIGSLLFIFRTTQQLIIDLKELKKEEKQ